jgi:hypothetical protein
VVRPLPDLSIASIGPEEFSVAMEKDQVDTIKLVDESVQDSVPDMLMPDIEKTQKVTIPETIQAKRAKIVDKH